MTNQSSQGNFSPNIDGDNNTVSVFQNIKGQVSNEIKTIQVMISSLTRLAQSETTTNGTERGEIDPLKKFNRFKEYEAQMKTLYTDLAIRYGEFYELVMNDVQLGRTDVDSISRLLRNKSIVILNKNNGNPLTSLDELCIYFEEHFFTDDLDNFEYDDGALRFFLYKQLVECNVFPNLHEQYK